MESTKISDQFTELTGSIKDYVELRIDMFRLILAEKLSRIFTFTISLMIFFILFNFIFMFISIAFILWYREYVGPAYTGALIVAGFYLLLGILVWILRKSLFINPVVSQISKILLEEDHEDE